MLFVILKIEKRKQKARTKAKKQLNQ